MRKPRQESESGIYHVVARGAGRQFIFEGDHDRVRYLDELERFAFQENVSILAWCLMSNHVHLLLNGDLRAVSRLMKMLSSIYAQYFNNRYDRVGPLFQGRFRSEPVDSDAYLITVLRYIHENPVKAGVAPVDLYPWSSYAEYVRTPRLCQTSRVLDIVGSMEEFVKLHMGGVDKNAYELMEEKSIRNLENDALIEWAISLIGKEAFRAIRELPKTTRDQMLSELRKSGMSVRQIERITGIGRGIISRAKCDNMT